MKSPHQPTPHERTPDERIDHVLAALNRTEPPDAGEELSQRVLQRLSAHSANTSRRRFSFLTGPPLIWNLLGACTVAALLAALLLAHRKPTETRAHTPAQNEAQTLLALSAPAQRAPGSPIPLPAHAGPSAVHAFPHGPRTPAASPLGIHPPRAEAQQQADIADGPAPELPLTEQEHLLLRIAYGTPPQQFASLKRFVVRIRPDDAEPDFDQFFEPYTLPLTQGDPQ